VKNDFIVKNQNREELVVLCLSSLENQNGDEEFGDARAICHQYLSVKIII
jgi:hypothetical protein